LYQPSPANFPGWLSPQPGTLASYSYRPRSQMRQLIDARNAAFANYLDQLAPDQDPSNQTYIGITHAAALKISMSTQVESSKHYLKALLSLISSSNNALYQMAYVALSRWDGYTNPTSSGAVLFTEWLRDYLSHSPVYSANFDPNNPLETPYGIDSSSSSTALSSLSTVANNLLNSGLPLNVTWGQVHLLPKDVNGISWPANGDCDPTGTVRAACVPLRGVGVRNVTAFAGCTWKAVVSFPADGPVYASVQMAYGNANQPGHRHNGDQWELFSKKLYRTAYLTRQDIEANLESKETL